MTIYAKVYERDGTTATLRTTYECESAEGVEVVNGIGYGKIVIPHYDNFRQDSGDRIPSTCAPAFGSPPRQRRHEEGPRQVSPAGAL